MERREIIRNLFTPEMLREHPKYKVLVEAVANELGRSSDSIELLPILGSPELMPAKYLPLLCEMLGIEYNYNQPSEAHREILKRIFEARKNRGCAESLSKAFRRGIDEEFFIEDLTYYNKKIQEQPVSFYPAYNRIFRYSVSKASENHYLESGDSWDMGFLVVECEDWSTRVQEKVFQVLPAGRLIWIHMFVTLYGEEALVLQPYESWDVNTGERTLSDWWPGPGEYGEVSSPHGEVGLSNEYIIEAMTNESKSAMMIYSVQGLLSGADLDNVYCVISDGSSSREVKMADVGGDTVFRRKYEAQVDGGTLSVRWHGWSKSGEEVWELFFKDAKIATLEGTLRTSSAITVFAEGYKLEQAFLESIIVRKDGIGTETSLAVLCGNITGAKFFDREMYLSVVSPYNGDADVGADIIDPSVDTVINWVDGFFFDWEETFTKWNGALTDDLDGGNFGSSSSKKFVYDGLVYKS